jgi:hypothetical protein
MRTLLLNTTVVSAAPADSQAAEGAGLRTILFQPSMELGLDIGGSRMADSPVDVGIPSEITRSSGVCQ